MKSCIFKGSPQKKNYGLNKYFGIDLFKIALQK